MKAVHDFSITVIDLRQTFIVILRPSGLVKNDLQMIISNTACELKNGISHDNFEKFQMRRRGGGTSDIYRGTEFDEP